MKLTDIKPGITVQSIWTDKIGVVVSVRSGTVYVNGAQGVFACQASQLKLVAVPKTEQKKNVMDSWRLAE